MVTYLFVDIRLQVTGRTDFEVDILLPEEGDQAGIFDAPYTVPDAGGV